MQTGSETLTYTVDSIDMLGINPLDKNQTSYMKDGKNSITDNLIYTLAKIRTEFVEQKSATTTNWPAAKVLTGTPSAAF